MERLAAKANLPVPKLYVIPEAAPNAFATGAIQDMRRCSGRRASYNC